MGIASQRPSLSGPIGMRVLRQVFIWRGVTVHEKDQTYNDTQRPVGGCFQEFFVPGPQVQPSMSGYGLMKQKASESRMAQLRSGPGHASGSMPLPEPGSSSGLQSHHF
jgi:hypothetical protein